LEHRVRYSLPNQLSRFEAESGYCERNAYSDPENIMNWTRFLAFAIVQLLALAACHSVNSYTGDGRLVDLGPFRLTTRYVVILGEVNVGTVGKATFKASGMPSSQYVLGLQFDKGGCLAMQSDARITMEMTNEQGEHVIHETNALRDLTWTYSLESKCEKPAKAYLSSKSVEVRSPDGTFLNHHRVLTGADNASGGYFKSREAGKYNIVITIHSTVEVLGEAKVILTES